MEYDKNIAQLFLLNFNEAYRSAKLLLMSCSRIAPLMPLKVEKFSAFQADDLDKMDAFRVRYCDLQDTLGNMIFRSLLKLEEEQPHSNLDALNKMEKRGILSSFEEWKQQRDIRNLFIPKVAEDLAFGRVKAPGIDDCKRPNIANMGSFAIDRSAGALTLAKNQIFSYFGYTHDYPETDEEKVEALNLASQNSIKLIGTVDNIIEYLQQTLDFPMDQFPSLLKDKEKTS